MALGSVTTSRIFIRPPHLEQTVTSTAKTRAPGEEDDHILTATAHDHHPQRQRTDCCVWNRHPSGTMRGLELSLETALGPAKLSAGPDLFLPLGVHRSQPPRAYRGDIFRGGWLLQEAHGRPRARKPAHGERELGDGSGDGGVGCVDSSGLHGCKRICFRSGSRG